MATSISGAQAELINSLAPDDIPIKLRCAICSKLAVNAFRLPCCEQAICEACQSNLPQSCPVCEHSPLSAEDCNPNKSLRTTIRVFLRTAEKKREASRPKEPKDSTPATPVEAVASQPPATESSTQDTTADKDVDATPLAEDAGPGPGSEAVEAPAGNNDKNHENGTAAAAPENGEQAESARLAIEQGDEDPTGNEAQDQDVEKPDGTEQAEDDEETYGPDATNGGFSNPNDFNQMQMMMAMQNGMAPNSFGGFPMMGMPGMGMDLMTMQNMYMNGGGFQGMGMNGMGDFGGGFGQDSNNNWNGSQSWNFDQNNYNQSGPGLGTGDFGSFNSGFQTGYNQQGNYGHHFNDYRRNNLGRGRGRGRGFYGGGYGRGGYQQGAYSNYQNQGPYGANMQLQNEAGTQGDASQESTGVDEHGREIGQDPSAEGQAQSSEDAAGGESIALASGEANPPNGPGVIRSVASTPDVPINAPKGPKAMRQGLPNTSLLNLRARGFQVGSEGPSSAKSNEPPRAGSTHPDDSRSSSMVRDTAADRASHHDGKGRSKDDDGSGRGDYDFQARDRGHSRSRSRTASRSRSRSRGHRSSQRRRRQRSESAERDASDDSYRRRGHSRKHSSYYEDDDEYARSKEDKYAERSRSASPGSSRRSSHRSRRDRNHERRKDRERDKYSDDDRKRSSHRSRRDREYEHSRRRDKDRGRVRDRQRDRDRDRDREKDRRDRKERHRERDAERGSRHGSSRKHSIDERSTPADKEFKPPTGPRGYDGKGAGSRSSHDRSTSDRRGSQASQSGGKDAHTLEREARNRERLLKEAQRMAGLAGLAGGKRGREEGDECDGGGRKGRRVSRRSETVEGGDEEERMRRLEAEREGGRWG